MSRIKNVFDNNAANILNVYVTAGFPALGSLPGILLALQAHGANLIEVGIPYSDPIADGPVIQQSSQAALENGMNLPLLLEQIHGIKEQVTVPVILMGYLNSILQYGMERFCSDAAAAGVSGVILPDMPFYEYEKMYASSFRKQNLDVIFLISPETTPDRLKKADKLSRGFLYAVSSSATTGYEQNKDESRLDWYKKIAKQKFKNPVLIGFGISNASQFKEASLYASGAIIGTAFIKWLQEQGAGEASIGAFMMNIKDVNNS